MSCCLANLHLSISQKYMLSHGAQDQRVTCAFASFYATHLNHTFTAFASGSAYFSVPTSQLQLMAAGRGAQHPLCMLAVVAELVRSPYPWNFHPWTVRRSDS